jgi:uridine kinase
MTIIAISGQLGSGKDTVGSLLLSQLPGATKGFVCRPHEEVWARSI